IFDNGSAGIEGRDGLPYTFVSGSRITGNQGSGVQSLGPMNGSVVYGNGGANGLDYEETRPSAELLETDLTGNYWGAETTAFMNANPWGTYQDVPAIHDFVDDTNLTAANYGGHLLSDNGAGPDLAPPAFLLSATPNLSNAANVGLVNFLLEFNEPMDTSIQPVVTFDTEFPFTEHVVEPIGWSSTTSPSSFWRGTFSVGIETGDGLNTIRVSGAKAADGFEIPDDTAHDFMIDTSPGTSLSNGVATPLGDSSMHIEWDSSVGVDLLGYSIRRANAVDGPYDLIASVPASVTETIDSGLRSNSTYFYQILEYDSDFNSRQLTSPFIGTTDVAPTPTPTDTSTSSPTSTLTRTPTATSSSTSTPTDTMTPFVIVTSTSTNTPSHSPTFTPTPSPSQTPTTTGTETPTNTGTVTVTPSSTFSVTPTASLTPTRTHTHTLSHTPTPTPTSTSTSTPTDTPNFDVGPSQTPDGQIDAHDLIQILQEGKSESTNWDFLFEFAQFWKQSK
ncbi:MAG: hypothetical protein KC994_20935, partial [Candidatus Omnitrophica bacterium]|nr:hypothetical protein [Candidatus Omnitrophota bacterium]